MNPHQPLTPGLKNHEDRELMQSPSADGGSGDESISDEENYVVSKFLFTSESAEVQRSYYRNFENENDDEACAWSAILEEADELVCLHKKTYSSSFISDISEARKIRKGGRGRAKLKFSIRSQSHKEELPWSSAVKDRNEKSLDVATEVPAGLDQITVENSMADLLGNLQEEVDEFPTKLVSHEQRVAMPSVAELLEDLQEKNVPSKGASNLLLQNIKAKERKTHFAGKRMMSSLGSRILDNEDPPEFLGGGMSSEDEDKAHNNLSFATQKIKGQTMTDLFQEAFSKSTEEEPLLPIIKQSRSGFHGRLQQVLQIEKDRNLEFLKKSQTECSPYDESRSIDVRILSRFLEAKLTVCLCLSGENIRGFQCGKGPQNCADDGGTTKQTIIFSSKICDNVELEVGNLVRIHPPWKEVQVNEDDKIILCMYFSQIMA